MSGSQNFPSLETIMNLVRAQSNDSFAGATDTPGEGQVLTDKVNTSINNPFILNLLNSAIRTMYRKIRNIGSPSLVKDNALILNLPVVDGPLGASTQDPSVEVRLGFDGYDPGNGVVNTSFVLPADLMQPLELYERQSNTTDSFMKMEIRVDGLRSVLQGNYQHSWEWRLDNLGGMSIFMPGAVQLVDLRLRYQAFLPQFFASNLDFANTFIPIFDCEEAVAYLMLEKIAGAISPSMAAGFKAQAAEEIFDLQNEIVRRKQRARYEQHDKRRMDEFRW